ncbi:MAG: transporter [Candidatus Rokuibacteriota bacterium]
MRTLGPALALLLGAGVAEAQPPPAPITPDRPDVANGTSTVGAGLVQIESGLGYSRTGAAGGAERRFSVEATLRLGLTDRLEFAINAEPFVRLRDSDEATGSGDYQLVLKWRFYDPPEGSGLPSLGVQPSVKLPTASAPIGTEKVDFGALALATFELPWDLSLDVNAGLAALGQTRPSGYLLQALVAATLGAEIQERWLPFVALAYASRAERDAGDTLSVQAGLVWRATRDVALDLSGQTSLIGQAPDYLLRVGVSVRFGR